MGLNGSDPNPLAATRLNLTASLRPEGHRWKEKSA